MVVDQSLHLFFDSSDLSILLLQFKGELLLNIGLNLLLVLIEVAELGLRLSIGSFHCQQLVFLVSQLYLKIIESTLQNPQALIQHGSGLMLRQVFIL